MRIFRKLKPQHHEDIHIYEELDADRLEFQVPNKQRHLQTDSHSDSISNEVIQTYHLP